ncbi:hypothetical protein [Streptomyces sp. RerS4]|uniref:hypothetical protein n=1 Tax=Streptomyces sp. RerS4 TaxID=2942449 RepID=UPI00201C1DF8|nr:hypothetical protein [Streptomyces sp. RerS4]UQW99109.1 hypothetical protein M4D82_00060 [Streptomyces sp. RerS4]
MKQSEIPDLLRHLRTLLAATTGMSIALSGSLARGDFRTRPDGTIISDLDLIPVIAGADDVASARRQLAPVLQDVADRFAITATAAITLDATRRKAPLARYLTSMAARPWLIDPLGLEGTTTPAADQANPFGDPSLPWLFQPVTYYLAKATHEDPVTNLVKARAAADHLLDHLRITTATDPLRDLPRTLAAIRDLYGLTPLPSSRTFLASPTDTAVFTTVRDLVFRENQGLAFADSAMAATPALPN